MSKTAVVYWSGTGNTEAMANAVAEGAKAAGAEVSLFTAAEFEAGLTDSFDSIAFGCPAMGAEVLEEDEFAPMFEACESKLKGKKIALFGSYGWGGEGIQLVHNHLELLKLKPFEKPFGCIFNPSDEKLAELEDYTKRVFQNCSIIR